MLAEDVISYDISQKAKWQMYVYRANQNMEMLHKLLKLTMGNFFWCRDLFEAICDIKL